MTPVRAIILIVFSSLAALHVHAERVIPLRGSAKLACRVSTPRSTLIRIGPGVLAKTLRFSSQRKQLSAAKVRTQKQIQTLRRARTKLPPRSPLITSTTRRLAKARKELARLVLLVRALDACRRGHLGGRRCPRSMEDLECEDDNECTNDDRCHKKSCRGEPLTSSDNVSCGVGVCRVTVPKCEQGALRSCVPLPPQNEACNGVDDNCDGRTDEGCEGSVCSLHDECASGWHCDTGMCTSKGAVGSACQDGTQCTSGYCNQSICCTSDTCCITDSDCAALNEPPVCSDAATCSGFQMRGTCGADFRCTLSRFDDPSACQAQICSGTSCTDGWFTDHGTCSLAGVCMLPEAQDCKPFVCSGATCSTSCASSADCHRLGFCLNNLCTLGLDNGSACTSTLDCKNGFCVDGVCCNSNCNGACQSCTLPGSIGRCSIYPPGQNPEGDCPQ